VTPPLPSLRRNVAALCIAQASALALPLLAAAYSTRALGAQAWGQVAMAQVVIAYFTAFASWGLYWTATRKIASQRDDSQAVSHIASATLLAQLMLCAVAVVLLLCLMATVPPIRREWPSYAWGIALVVGSSMFPAWLYNGLEQMTEYALIQLVSRAAALAAMVVLVDGPGDAPFVIAASAIGAGTAALIGLVRMRKVLRLSMDSAAWRCARAEVREGAAFFAATLSTNVYMGVAPLVVGAIMGPVAAGHYALADRIRLAAQSALQPVAQAVFPRMSFLVRSDRPAALALLQLAGGVTLMSSAAISLCLYLAAVPLTLALGGPAFVPAAHILKWLAWVPLLTSASAVLGPQVLLPLQRANVYNAIVIGAGAFCLAAIGPLVWHLNVEGAALTTLLTELGVSAAMLVCARHAWRGRPTAS
jgi:O-antigen/teichoic acid export membrane protein